MKRSIAALVCVLAFSAISVSGQIFKLPQLGPKPTPKPASTPTMGGPVQTPNNSGNNSGPSNAQPPAATDNPVLLKTTLDIRCDTENRYWKMPTESNYTSWIPQLKFKVRYAGATKLRLMAEYFTPDGKPWFSETLGTNMSNATEKTVDINSERGSGRFEGKSTIATGLFGVKITDSRDGSVLFQGKFKVGKFKYGPNIPMFKNQNDFFVDQDWNLPIGYVWLDWSKDRNAPLPTISIWIKGERRLDDLEGRLFYNDQQIATTDDMGSVSFAESRFPNSNENKDSYLIARCDFQYFKFHYAANAQGRKTYPQAKFMNDMDGNYTVKVYHKGIQIREASFGVSGGMIADNGVASGSSFNDTKVIIPVKILGNMDKWNSATWKTDAFYGNPLTGFTWP